MPSAGWVALAVLVYVALGATLYARKEGVTGEIRPEMLPAVATVESIWLEFGLEPPVLTSVSEGQHMQGSLHYEGLAHDWRLRDVPAYMRAAVISAVKMRLAPIYDVIDEGDHLHIEYDPG